MGDRWRAISFQNRFKTYKSVEVRKESIHTHIYKIVSSERENIDIYIYKMFSCSLSYKMKVIARKFTTVIPHLLVVHPRQLCLTPSGRDSPQGAHR